MMISGPSGVTVSWKFLSQSLVVSSVSLAVKLPRFLSQLYNYWICQSCQLENEITMILFLFTWNLAIRLNVVSAYKIIRIVFSVHWVFIDDYGHSRWAGHLEWSLMFYFPLDHWLIFQEDLNFDLMFTALLCKFVRDQYKDVKCVDPDYISTNSQC